MKIVFLSGWFPLPVDNGSKLRIFNLLRGLCAQHEVTLLSFYRREDELEHLPQMRSLCAKVEVVPWCQFNPISLRAQLGYFSPRPRSVIDTFSRQMAALISETLISEPPFQLGILSESPMLAYADCFQGLPLLLEDLELAVLFDGFRTAESPLKHLRNGLTWWKTARYTAARLGKMAACTVVSQEEKALVNQIAPAYQPVEVIPNCIDFDHYLAFTELPKADRLIHTGSLAYQANYEAVVFFLEQIWPRIIAALPEVEFWITGRSEGYPLPPAAEDPRVHLTGYVDDIRPVIASSAVSVVPLLTGAGTRLKILESLALNTAVVTTSKGAQGLDLCHGEHLLIADSPGAFAEAVLHLLIDDALRVKLARSGRQAVYQKYNWNFALPIFLKFVEKFTRSNNI
jgi:polysaccharide biosynthesis protein PslH